MKLFQVIIEAMNIFQEKQHEDLNSNSDENPQPNESTKESSIKNEQNIDEKYKNTDASSDDRHQQMIPALESTANSADQYIGSKSNSRPGTNPTSATDYVPSGTNSRSRSGADYVSSGSDSGSETHSKTRSNSMPWS